jgi:hypothetical protein
MPWTKHLTTFVLTGVLTAMVAACGGDDNGSAAKDFTNEDLAKLNFAPSEAPPGTEYDSRVSGKNMLERESGTEEIIARLRERGFEADYGAQFSRSSRKRETSAGPYFTESIALLFKDPDAASSGLDLLKQLNSEYFKPAKEIERPELGQESWGVSGKQQGKYPTYIYGWRISDVVQLLNVSPGGPKQTLVLARRLAAHASQ